MIHIVIYFIYSYVANTLATVALATVALATAYHF